MQKSTEIDYLIDEMIENDFIDFKSEFYKKDNKRERIKDIVAFANSHSNEPSRYIIFGIKEGQGSDKRVFHDLVLNEDPAELQQLIQNNVEPDITFNLYEYRYQGHKLIILEITENNDRPYMIKKDIMGLKKGDIFIRSNSTIRKAERRDLDLIYKRKQNVFNSKDVDLNFSPNGQKSEKFQETIIRETSKLPSSLRKKEILTLVEELKGQKELIELNKDKPALGNPIFGNSKFRYDKILVGKSEFGIPIYEDEDELQDRLEKIDETYSDDNEFYIFTEIAEQINFVISNTGSVFLKDMEVKITIPEDVGYIFTEFVEKPKSIFDRISPVGNTYFNGYPNVETSASGYVITEYLDTLRHKTTEELFSEPLRIVFNNEKNNRVECTYIISAENLPQPITGKLFIEIELNEKDNQDT